TRTDGRSAARARFWSRSFAGSTTTSGSLGHCEALRRHPRTYETETIAATVDGVSSVLDRAGVDYEVIVVDDASTDDTAAAVGRLAKTNTRSVRALALPPAALALPFASVSTTSRGATVA